MYPAPVDFRTPYALTVFNTEPHTRPVPAVATLIGIAS